MLKHILPLIPDHDCYVEAFAGGLAVLMAKPRSPVEVVNDLNGDLIALYRCVQYHLPELERELTHMVSSRQMLKDYLAQPGLTDIQRSARFYLRHRISFGGKGRTYGVTKTRGGGAAFRAQENHDLLGAARTRLDGVMVEHTSYEKCMGLYDSSRTLFFLDPPYVGSSFTAYAGWQEDDARRFRKILDKVKGKWIVTLGDCDLVRELFKGCRIQEVETRNGACNNATDPGKTFPELLITPP